MAIIAIETKNERRSMLIISDILWNEIAPIIPAKKNKIGRPQKNARIVLSGIFYIMLTGVQWCHLPDYYGKKSTVHGRFSAWARSKLLKNWVLPNLLSLIHLLLNPHLQGLVEKILLIARKTV